MHGPLEIAWKRKDLQHRLRLVHATLVEVLVGRSHRYEFESQELTDDRAVDAGVVAQSSNCLLRAGLQWKGDSIFEWLHQRKMDLWRSSDGYC